MTCRVARSFGTHIQTEPVYCCECGSIHLGVFLASKNLGPYLCQICARSFVERGGGGTHGANAKKSRSTTRNDP